MLLICKGLSTQFLIAKAHIYQDIFPETRNIPWQNIAVAAAGGGMYTMISWTSLLGDESIKIWKHESGHFPECMICKTICYVLFYMAICKNCVLFIPHYFVRLISVLA